MLIQILVTAGIIFFVFPSVLTSYKKHTLTIWGFILWLSFWIIGIVVIWVPDLIRFLGEKLGVARSIDALIYISIVYLLYNSFKQKIKLIEIKKEITTLNREFALKDIKKKKD